MEERPRVQVRGWKGDQGHLRYVLPLHLVHLIYSLLTLLSFYPAVADDIASFSSSSGLIFDASPLLGGPRAKRSAMVIENGKVLHVAVEDEPPQ
jgi:hypothetical protein